ncbi:MAG: hypothetical protein ACRDZZ_04870 [Ilumatobacteraceae bacterium]
MASAGYNEILRPLFEGRKIVFVGEVAAGFTPSVELARALGAAAVLVVATGGRGLGPLPDGVELFVLEPEPATSMLDGIRRHLARVEQPPAAMVDAVRAFDPEGAALVVGTFLNTADHLDGRPFLAHRRPEWVALEDKTVVDALWDRAGVERAPAGVVPAQGPTLASAARDLDAGAGTVWSGDGREGFNGGAEYVRWVRTAGDAAVATAFFAAHCDTVRVMPFLEGIPCSIHGLVFSGHVAAIRPVEMVTLRRPPGHPEGAFFYAGCSSFYDPPPTIRTRMREIACTVGELLRAEVDYHGAFTIDGVVTAGGFLPTELNPRSGAGLNVMARSIPDLPLQVLLDALVGGVDLDYDPRDLERDLVAAADARRGGGTWRTFPDRELAAVDSAALTFDGASWHPAGDGENGQAVVAVGTGAPGSFVRAVFDPESTPVGESVAPRAVAFWEYADRNLGTAIGPLSPGEPS